MHKNIENIQVFVMEEFCENDQVTLSYVRRRVLLINQLNAQFLVL